MPEVVHPMCDVRVYDPGADGYVSDQGQNVYDVLMDSYDKGWVSPLVNGTDWQQPSLVVIPELGGMTNAPILKRQAFLMNAAWWNKTSGDWDFDFELPCPEGITDAASCFNVCADHYSVLTSKFDAPSDPDFWFECIVGVQSWDDLEEPYAGITWGDNTWGVALLHNNGLAFYHNGSEGWEIVAELPWNKIMETYPGTAMGGSYLSLLVLHRRGRWLLSTDNGGSYVAYDDGSGCVCPPGKVRFYNKGQWALYMMHRVGAEEGTFRGELIPLFEDRATQVPVGRTTDDWHAHVPDGTSITVNQVATWPAHPTHFQYEAVLTPATVTPDHAPIVWKRCPTLMSVEMEYPVSLVGPTPGAYTSLADVGVVEDIDVTCPEEEGADTGTVQCLLNPGVAFSTEYRWLYTEIDLGYHYDDASDLSYAAFAGYIASFSTAQMPDWEHGLKLELELIDASWLAKSASVTEAWRPLDGMTVAQGLDYAADQIGIPADMCYCTICGYEVRREEGEVCSDMICPDCGIPLSARGGRRNWHADCSSHVLQAGLPERPIWWRTGVLPCGTSVWEAMRLMAQVCGLDIHVRRDGVWETYDPTSFDATVHALDNGDTAAWDTAVARLERTAESVEGRTAAIAKGETSDGMEAAAWLIDYDREHNPLAVPFAGCRMFHRHEGQECAEFSTASTVAQLMYDLDHLSQFSLGIGLHNGRPDIYKRQRVTVANATAAGVEAAVEWGVKEIRHSWGPHMADCDSAMTTKEL